MTEILRWRPATVRWIKNVLSAKNAMPTAPSIVPTQAGWSINWLAEQSEARRSEILLAEMLVQSCVHEAGHALMTEIFAIDTQWLQMNGLADIYVPPSGEEKSIDSGISIANTNRSEKVKNFFLGGLLGEVLFSGADANARFNKFSINPLKSKTDINYLVKNFDDDSAVRELLKNYKKSDGGEFRTIFFENVDFSKIDAFVEMQKRRDRHVAITKTIYKKWQLAGFGRFRLQAASGRLQL